MRVFLFLAGSVFIACSSSGTSDDSGTDGTNPQMDATNDTSNKDSGMMDSNNMDTSMDSTNDVAMDSANDSGGDAGGPYAMCWMMGTSNQCKTCCDMVVPMGFATTAPIIGNCLCSQNVCGTPQTCGNSICLNQTVTSGCSACFKMKIVANGPCNQQYMQCQQNMTCKKYVDCLSGCP